MNKFDGTFLYVKTVAVEPGISSPLSKLKIYIMHKTTRLFDVFTCANKQTKEL